MAEQLPYARTEVTHDDTAKTEQEDLLEVFSPGGGQLAGASEPRGEQSAKAAGASSAGNEQPPL